MFLTLLTEIFRFGQRHLGTHREAKNSCCPSALITMTFFQEIAIAMRSNRGPVAMTKTRGELLHLPLLLPLLGLR